MQITFPASLHLTTIRLTFLVWLIIPGLILGACVLLFIPFSFAIPLSGVALQQAPLSMPTTTFQHPMMRYAHNASTPQSDVICFLPNYYAAYIKRGHSLQIESPMTGATISGTIVAIDAHIFKTNTDLAKRYNLASVVVSTIHYPVVVLHISTKPIDPSFALPGHPLNATLPFNHWNLFTLFQQAGI
jgi:hypothetical protein